MHSTSPRKVFQGVIFKKGQLNKSWKERWFVLYANRKLAYFESKKSSQCIKEIDLSEVQSIHILAPNKTNNNNNNDTANNSGGSNEPQNTSTDLLRKESIMPKTSVNTTDRENSFALITAKRTYVLCCAVTPHMNQWIDHLERSIFGERIHQGWLTKRGAYRKNWKQRWFVIYDIGEHMAEMRYYDDNSRSQPRGLIKLHSVLLMCPGDSDQYSKPYTIQLMTPDRNWVLSCQSLSERDDWFVKLEETIVGAKRLITSHEGYLWKKSQLKNSWKKRYFALSKGWLFYFEEQFHCNKFKSIAFFSEAFFNQAFQLYVKGSVPLHETTIEKFNSVPKPTQKKPKPKSKPKSPSSSSANAPQAPQQSGEDDYEHKEFVFKITTDHREFYFSTATQQDLDDWFESFHSTHQPQNMLSTDDAADMSKDTLPMHLQNSVGNTMESLASDAEDDADENDDISNNNNNNNNNNMSAQTDGNNNNNAGNNDENGGGKEFFDLIDPNHTSKWVDIETEEIERHQSKATEMSLQRFEEQKLRLSVNIK